MRWIVRAAALLTLALGGRAIASPPAGTCFAVVPLAAGDLPPPRFRCTGTPAGYREASLWLRLPFALFGSAGAGDVVVQSTRFDRLQARFAYADGSSDAHQVRRGAFGRHWHIGSQISFPARAQPTAIWLRVDRLKSYDLLRLRVLPGGKAPRQFELCAALIGAALSLLALAAIYNFGLALVVRKRFFLWLGLWAAAMVCWGLVWSQGALFVFPRLAGTASSQMAAVLSCLAILCASLGAVSGLKGTLAPWAGRAIVVNAIGIVVLGVIADLPGVDLGVVALMLTVATLVLLAAIGVALAAGWRRDDREARELAIAWIGPMLVLAASDAFDFDTILFGGGGQITVLFASALQTVCLSSLATYRLGRLRAERDAALAAEAALLELAERDALTGMLNRRGFVRRTEEAFGARRDAPFGLLLIDVDRFKGINDHFGHETGDAVLVDLAERLRALERSHQCLAGRLGGEEFVIGVSGLGGRALREFAETVRETLRTSDERAAAGGPRITVSIGVAEGCGSGPFHGLYGKADRALYEAKAGGRNSVVFLGDGLQDPSRQISLPFRSRRR